jgi:hypothetical protein
MLGRIGQRWRRNGAAPMMIARLIGSISTSSLGGGSVFVFTGRFACGRPEKELIN